MVPYMLPFYFVSAFTSTTSIPSFHYRTTTTTDLCTLHSFTSPPRLQNAKATSKDSIQNMHGPEGQTKELVKWIIRPATVDDRDGCAALIQLSYRTLLAKDYSEECLAKCLPLISTPREQLLTCNTWFVVEHPSTQEIVGCGGWTLRSPLANSGSDTAKTEEATNSIATEDAPSCKDPVAPVPHLRHFATHPGYARMGIASTIWQKIHSEISKQFSIEGKPFPEMEVFSTLTAEGFYAACGFEVVSRFDMTLAKDAVFPVILMRRRPTE